MTVERLLELHLIRDKTDSETIEYDTLKNDIKNKIEFVISIEDLLQYIADLELMRRTPEDIKKIKELDDLHDLFDANGRVKWILESDLEFLIENQKSNIDDKNKTVSDKVKSLTSSDLITLVDTDNIKNIDLDVTTERIKKRFLND